MRTTQRTPGPMPQIRAHRANYGASATTWNLVSVDTGGLIADAYNYHAQIVIACNAHDELVAALRGMCDAYGNCGSPRQQDAANAARAALAKVK